MLSKRKQPSDFTDPACVKLQKTDCPYLGQINRSVLDFDFEKVCSISLQKDFNIYCCLACGLYFRGKGVGTEAYIHSLETTGHNVFINLQNASIYCLPDNYEVFDASLNDIKQNLRPVFSKDISILKTPSTNLDGHKFWPGFVGLNNLIGTDYINVVIHAITKIDPIVMHCLFSKTPSGGKNKSFIELVKKIWNPKNLKGQVCPHEFSQAVSLASDKKFKIGEQSDPMDFLIWFINQTKFIQSHFQGKMQVDNQKIPFFYLGLDIPMVSVFKDKNLEKNTVKTTIPISELLNKYNGEIQTNKKSYKILETPEYLVLHLKRFVHNNFFLEKNPTLVSFPMEGLEIQNSKYDLMANIIHDGDQKAGIYKIQIQNPETWVEIQDLHITKIMAQQVADSESYILVYKKV